MNDHVQWQLPVHDVMETICANFDVSLSERRGGDRSGKVRNECAGDVALKIYRSDPMICHCLLHFYANSLPQTVSLSLHLHTL